MSEPLDLEKLRALAEKATSAEEASSPERRLANAAFVAAANPQTVLALLALLSRLQECEKALRPFADVKVPEHAWDEDWGLADIGSGVDLLKAGHFRAAASYFQSRSKSEGEGRG